MIEWSDQKVDEKEVAIFLSFDAKNAERVFAVMHVTANNHSVTANNLVVVFFCISGALVIQRWSTAIRSYISYSEMLIRIHRSFPTDRPSRVWYPGGKWTKIHLNTFIFQKDTTGQQAEEWAAIIWLLHPPPCPGLTQPIVTDTFRRLRDK
jgi:hypothetical protein